MSAEEDDQLDSMTEADLRRLLKHLRANHPRVFNVALGSLPPLPSSGETADAGYASKDSPAPTPTEEAPAATPNRESSSRGCYMVYDSDEAKLTLRYSDAPISGAVGFFSAGPGHEIQKFKFTRNFGRSDLIKNCASGISGRKNYYSGWCQFVRAARALNGSVTVFPVVEERMGLDVDLFAYYGAGRETVKIPVGEPFEVATIDAVACLPEHASFYTDLAVDLTKWMTDASTVGAATAFVEIEVSDEYKAIAGDKAPSDVAALPRSAASAPPAVAVRSRPSPKPTQLEGKAIDSESPPQAAAAAAASSDEKEKEGCYLVYDSDGAKLMLNYSRTEVTKAVGFWSPGPGKKIQGFKFKQNFGRSELIRNCASGVAGRKNYYSGWCQYIRLAKLSDGSATCMPLADERPGLDVDVFFYRNDARPGHQTVQMVELTPYDLTDHLILAVACLPKHTEFNNYLNLTVDINKWMTEASAIGAASRFE